MRDDDHVLFTEPFSVVKHFSVVLKHQPFVGVGTGEGLVESTSVFSHGNPEGTEPFLSSPVKDLKGGMGGDNTDRDGVLVITLEPFLHGCEWYAHMEGFRNRSMSIMSRKHVDAHSIGFEC